MNTIRSHHCILRDAGNHSGPLTLFVAPAVDSTFHHVSRISPSNGDLSFVSAGRGRSQDHVSPGRYGVEVKHEKERSDLHATHVDVGTALASQTGRSGEHTITTSKYWAFNAKGPTLYSECVRRFLFRIRKCTRDGDEPRVTVEPKSAGWYAPETSCIETRCLTAMVGWRHARRVKVLGW